MVIQCQSCTHKFRLNLERLPARKVFVRCKHCGTPIYIHGEEEEPSPPSSLPESVTIPEQYAESPVIPPWLAGLPVEDSATVLVTCPQCESRYRIPPEPLRRPDIKLKCTQCEAVFRPAPELLQPQPPPTPGAVLPPEQVAAASPAPEVPGSPGLDADAVIPKERVVLEPDEARMSAMLSDMAPEPGIRRAVPTPPPKQPSVGQELDAEQAYLEATSLGEAFVPPERGTVPDATKYSLFLKPGELTAGRPEPAPAPAPEPPPAPEVPPAPLPPQAEELPPLDAGPGAPPPPLETKPSPPPEPELPPLPMAMPEQPRKPPDKKPVPDQTGWLTTRARYLALAAAAAAILIGTGVWTAWLWKTPGSDRPFTVETGRVHHLALEQEPQGRYVRNIVSGQRLFVVQGTVENRFPANTDISWIRLRGTAYAGRDQSQTLATAFAFIGNVLSDQQLASWEPEAILAFHAYNNGRDNANFRIPSGAKVPFQLVFPGVKQPVGRTVIQVVSYHRNGLAVYVDPGR